MRRLVPGTRIHLADGRRMTVLRILTIDGIRCVWWRPDFLLKRKEKTA